LAIRSIPRHLMKPQKPDTNQILLRPKSSKKKVKSVSKIGSSKISNKDKEKSELLEKFNSGKAFIM